MSVNGWNVLPDDTTPPPPVDTPANAMYSGYCGPSAHVMPHTDTPRAMFEYFLPKSFWRHVAFESNRYEEQTRDKRCEKIFQDQEAAIAKDMQERGRTSRVPKTRSQIAIKLSKFKKIKPHELLRWIGLHVARVLSPFKSTREHWATKQRGAVPQGTFGDFMTRDRFEEISRYLHFSDNKSPLARSDRAWKIRPILNTIETSFKQGYVLGARVALDEGMLPNRNKMNPTRTFMKDKPHKWGSKCVLTCCADTGYCKR